MSIRRIFLLLIVPLFLLLAGVNGALLYFWEKGEAARGLENQAVAAAVTVAAFAEANRDLAVTLAEPKRATAIKDAVKRIEGLDAVYLVERGKPQRIAGTGPSAPPGRYEPPRAATALAIRTAADGRRVAPALAPAGDGRFVVALIDAEPLVAKLGRARLLVAALVGGAGLLGLVLAGLVARRIARELARDSEMIEAIRHDAPPPDTEDLRIRETHDLAKAVRLMRASVDARQTRGRRELALRDRRRSEAGAARAHQQVAFPPFASKAGGAAAAARMLGDPAPGAFYAVCDRADSGLVVLGVCQADGPAKALAAALAARRWAEAGPDGPDVEAWIERGRRAFGIERLAWRAWNAGNPPREAVLALMDDADARRAKAYGARAKGLTPAETADDLASLLDGSGLVAVVGSAESGER